MKQIRKEQTLNESLGFDNVQGVEDDIYIKEFQPITGIELGYIKILGRGFVGKLFCENGTNKNLINFDLSSNFYWDDSSNAYQYPVLSPFEMSIGNHSLNLMDEYGRYSTTYYLNLLNTGDIEITSSFYGIKDVYFENSNPDDGEIKFEVNRTNHNVTATYDGESTLIINIKPTQL